MFVGLEKMTFISKNQDGASKGGSKGRFEMSWIWLVPKSKSEVDRNSSEQVFDEGL
jgi:hypothetical protein